MGRARRSRRGAALLATVLLVTLAATMSAVLVRQSMSLARAESERLGAELARQCANELRSVTESALLSDPNIPLEPRALSAEQFSGARVLNASGRVVAAGSPERFGVSGCVEGFNAAQHRALLELPTDERPTLKVLYASESGNVRQGTVVEYTLDSVSRFQVWSDERLDLAGLHTFGEARDDTQGSGTQPAASDARVGGAAGIVGLIRPSGPSEVTASLRPVEEMELTFTAPGGRRYRITSVMQPRNSAAGEVLLQQIVRNGVTLQAGLVPLPNVTNPVSHELTVVDVPFAGQVTYQVRAQFAASPGQNFRSPGFQPYLLVEDVGPADIADPERELPDAAAGGLVAIGPDPHRPGEAFQPDLTFGSLWQLPRFPAVGTAQVGITGDGVPRSQQATFVAEGGRAYRVVSLVHPYGPGSPGAVVSHALELVSAGAGGGEQVEQLRAGLVPLANIVNAFSHQLETVWVAPAGFSEEVTVRTRMSYAGPEGQVVNYVGGGLNPYIAVFDLGPVGLVGPTPPAGPRPAGLAGSVSAAAFTTGTVSPAGSGVASVTVPAYGDRVYRVVSLVQAASVTLSDVGFHRIISGDRTIQSSLLAPANDVNAFAAQLSALDTPRSGVEVTYGTTVGFASADGRLVSTTDAGGAFQPLLFVEDLGRIGALTFGDATVLAGAVYGAEGVQAFTDAAGEVRSLPSVQLGVAPSSDGASSPRHLQVLSPSFDPGPSLTPNASSYTDIGADSRLPSGAGQGSVGRISGRGAAIADARTAVGVSSATPPQMRLETSALAASVADRIELACTPGAYTGVCLSAGALLTPESAAVSRPAGVVGYATPTVGSSAAIGRGEAPTLIAGQSVAFVADGTRMYRITSVLRPSSTVPGDMLDHRIVRNGVAVQSGLFPLESTEMPAASTLVKFDAPQAGLVTYATAARLAAVDGAPDGQNNTLSDGTTFLLVEDVGPVGGAAPPLDGAGGVVDVRGPVTPISGVFTAGSLQAVPGQSVSFQAPGDRRYEIVSTVMPYSQAPGNMVEHRVGRRVGDNQPTFLAQGRLALANTQSLNTHQLVATDVPPAGAITYTSYLRFELGPAQENSNWVVVPSHRPAIAVLDAGPAVLPEALPAFPAGLVAASVPESPGALVGEPTVTFTARTGRLYRVEAQTQVSSDLPGDVATVVLSRVTQRTVDGAPVTDRLTVQRVQVLPVSTGVAYDETLTALDIPATSEDREVTYELVALFASEGTPEVQTVSLGRVIVVDVGPAARVTGAVGGEFVRAGAGPSTSIVPRPVGLVRAAFAPTDQSVGAEPTTVNGQEVTLESDGTRRYRITSVVHPASTLPAEVLSHTVVRNPTGTDRTVLQSMLTAVESIEAAFSSQVVVFDAPPAGRVTYTTQAAFADGGELFAAAGSGARAFIMVEDVGPALGGIIPPSAAGGLLGEVAYASNAAQTFPAEQTFAVAGQSVEIDVDPTRRYQVTSVVHPFDLSAGVPVAGQTPPVALAAVHQLVRRGSDGQEQVVAAALTALPNSVNAFGHVLTYSEPGAGSGRVTYLTRLKFFGGAGGNLVTDGFRPFLAVLDAGPVEDPAGGAFPEGVVAAVTQDPGAVFEQVETDPDRTIALDTLEVALDLPGGRLYRISSVVHPAFVDAGADTTPVTFSHQLFRVVDGVETLVQQGGGWLPEPGTSTAPAGLDGPLDAVTYHHELVALDAPVATGSPVTYRVRLVLPGGGTARSESIVNADGRFVPQLVVEDIGLARELPSVFGFDPSATPATLSGSGAAALVTRVPDDALAFRITALPETEDEPASLLVESCPDPVCATPSSAAFLVPLRASGLVVVDGYTILSGEFSRPTTMIVGSMSRPADLVVDTATGFAAPVQLVATDRVVLDVRRPDVAAELTADLVGLGLASSGVPFAATGTWSEMLTLSGSLAGPRVSIVEAFGARGPVRLVPRTWDRQAPWAVGFSNEWTAVAQRPATATELRALYGR